MARGGGRRAGQQVERLRLRVRGCGRLRAALGQSAGRLPVAGGGVGGAALPAAWLSLISAASCAFPPLRNGVPRSTSTFGETWIPARCGRSWGSWETEPSARSTRWVLSPRHLRSPRGAAGIPAPRAGLRLRVPPGTAGLGAEEASSASGGSGRTSDSIGPKCSRTWGWGKKGEKRSVSLFH